MRNKYTCAVCQYSWLSSKIVKRCSNPACRSMKWNNQSSTPVADLPAEKKTAEASPDKKETIGGLQALIDSIHAKTKPVENQPEPYNEPEYSYGDI